MFIFSASRRLWRLSVGPLATLLLLSSPFTVTGVEPFQLTTTPDQLISLRANQASLQAIVEQIARELKIEIQANIADDEKVTEEFNNIPLERALKLLSHNYITVTERKSGKIAKIFFLPQGQEAPRIITEARPPAMPTTAIDNIEQSQDGSTTAAIPGDEGAVTSNQDKASEVDKPESETPEETIDQPEPGDNTSDKKGIDDN